MKNPESYEHASFYYSIFNCFDEVDEQCEGRSTYDRFDKFISRAAIVPRHCDFAQPESCTKARKKMFKPLATVANSYLYTNRGWFRV